MASVQRDLVDRIFDLFFVGDHRLVDVGRDLAGLLVQFAAHVFLGLVELARGQGDGLLDRADNDAGVDALLLAEELDTLIQSAGGHTLLTLFRFSGAELSRRVGGDFLRSYSGVIERGKSRSQPARLPVPGSDVP